MLPENFDNITPEMAKDWLRRAMMLLSEEDREELLRPYREKYVAEAVR